MAGKRGVVSVSVQARTDQFRRGMKRAEKTLHKFGRTVRGIRSSLGGMLGIVAGGALMQSAIRTIAGFEETMARLRGVTGATADQFVALTEKARELGSVTRFSARQAAEGLLSLSRIGFTVNESLASIGSTLDLATAQSMDFATAADIAASAVRQFGLHAADTQRVTDTFSNTANSAGTTVLDAAEAMKMAGTVAAAFGNDIETTAAAIGVLGDMNIRGTMAGTSLRGIMAELASATGDQLKAIEDLGLAYADIDPRTTDLVTIFERLAEANFSVDEGLRIFTKRTFVAALALSKYSGKLRELTEANRRAKGTTRELAALLEDTLTGSFLALRSAIEETMLQLGDKGLAGSLKRTVDSLTDAVRILNESPGAFEDASEGGRELAATLKSIGETWDSIATAFLTGIATIDFALAGLGASAKLAHLALRDVLTELAQNAMEGDPAAVLARLATPLWVSQKGKQSDIVDTFREEQEKARAKLLKILELQGRPDLKRALDPEGFEAGVSAAAEERLAKKWEGYGERMASGFSKSFETVIRRLEGPSLPGPPLPVGMAGRSGAYGRRLRPPTLPNMDDWLATQPALKLPAIDAGRFQPVPKAVQDREAFEAGFTDAYSSRATGAFGAAFSDTVTSAFMDGVGNVDFESIFEGLRESLIRTIADAVFEGFIAAPIKEAASTLFSSLASSAA